MWKNSRRLQFPDLLPLLLHSSDDSTISVSFPYLVYFDEKKILPVLSISHRVTVRHPQDGFSRSENGSRVFLPTVRNRCFITHCYRAFAVNVRGILPRGAHIQPTAISWSPYVHAFASSVDQHACICILLQHRR